MEKELTDKCIHLGKGQEKIIDIIENSMDNIFITGEAGSGKTTSILEFIRRTNKDVIVLAPTGVAALNIGGMTLHSFFELPLTVQNLDSPKIGKISNKKRAIIKNIDTMFIDEISMVPPDILEAINIKCQKIRNCGLPFGGIQVIFSGDLYQIPPVIKNKLINYYIDVYGGKYFFYAPLFKWEKLPIYELQHIFRQSDNNFKKLLNQIRYGNRTKEILECINERVITPTSMDGIITLATTNDVVDSINKSKLDELKNKEFIFNANIKGNIKENSFPTEGELHLKVGAQIMMVVNDSGGRWCNGTLGTITELSDNVIKVKINGREYDVERFTWENIEYDYDSESQQLKKSVIGKFEQFPIKLAWAITIHKSQGKTYDSVLIDFGDGAFDTGQAYVALSRCTSLDKLYLKKPIKPKDIKVDPEVIKYMANANIIKLDEVELN